MRFLKLSKERFIDVFNDINELYINNIKKAKAEIIDFSEKELFDDFVETYSRSYKMINRGKLVDGIVLLRNSFELMMILFGMRIDKNVKEEYCREDSYERYQERKSNSKKAKDYLSQSYLRNILLKRYPNIESEYQKIYNALSKYAHPTIHRNVIRFFEREKTDVTLLYLNTAILVPILFIELLNEQCIIPDERFEDMALLKYVIERLTLIYLTRNVNTNDILKANIYVFAEINNDYYNKQSKEITDDFKNMEKYISERNEQIKELLNKVLSKVEYYQIGQKLLKLEIVQLKSEEKN